MIYHHFSHCYITIIISRFQMKLLLKLLHSVFFPLSFYSILLHSTPFEATYSCSLDSELIDAPRVWFIQPSVCLMFSFSDSPGSTSRGDEDSFRLGAPSGDKSDGGAHLLLMLLH